MDRLMPMANRIAEQLKARQETVAISESSTGGLVSAALLAVPGASAYFVGAGVIYTREARRVLLGLPDDQVKMRGATEEYAALAAETTRPSTCCCPGEPSPPLPATLPAGTSR